LQIPPNPMRTSKLEKLFKPLVLKGPDHISNCSRLCYSVNSFIPIFNPAFFH
jgi:hypothetical protein